MEGDIQDLRKSAVLEVICNDLNPEMRVKSCAHSPCGEIFMRCTDIIHPQPGEMSWTDTEALTIGEQGRQL